MGNRTHWSAIEYVVAIIPVQKLSICEENKEKSTQPRLEPGTFRSLADKFHH